jgi:RNA polymerase sigma-70 factor (sigma-E family)
MRDDSGYVAFVTGRWPSLYRFAFLLTGSQSTAEDLLQSVLERLYVVWPRVGRVEAPEAYARRMLVNRSISDGRRGVSRRESACAETPEVVVDAGVDAVMDRAVLWPLIQQLPPRQRAVVVLRYYEDLTEAEIARVLDCAPGTVKAHASSAMRSMRAMLKESPAGGAA